MKLFSKTLNKNIDLLATTRLSDNKKVIIVTHKSLLNCFNEIQLEHKLKLELKELHISLNHNVFLAKISDKNGFEVQEIGETTPDTLNSQIARENPALVAAQKAFDRAIIQYLNFRENVYSIHEISPFDTKPAAQIKTTIVQEEKERFEYKETPLEVSVKKPKKDDMTINIEFDEPIKYQKVEVKKESNAEAKVEKTTRKATQVDNATKEVVATSSSEHGAVVIDLGKYKNKGMTIREIYETDPAWLEKIIRFKVSSPEGQKQLDSITRFLKEVK